MSGIKSPLELYKVLPRSNCGRCGVPSCMAFAAAVVEGRKAPADCPDLSAGLVAELARRLMPRRTLEDETRQVIDGLRLQVAKLDFTAIAERCGARLVDGSLAVPSLGKDFLIDPSGAMSSDCHINHWIHAPLLHYLLLCRGEDLHGNWLPYGELADAAEWAQYFRHRCEEALRLLADAHTGLVFELLHLFGAKPLTSLGGADHSLVIFPLPKVPFLINYWEAEDGFPSQLNILLDASVGRNINAVSINLLARGIVEMFRQLVVRHSREGVLFPVRD